jgi:hypothetical protein
LVKNLLKILIGGVVAFNVIAVTQEWRVFAQAWFGSAPAQPQLTDLEKKLASDTVREMLTLMGHFYATGGDPRFAERMPASSAVMEEMKADVDYLARNHRVQTPTLNRLEVTSVEPIDEAHVEVRTRELWIIRLRWGRGSQDSEPPQPSIAYGKYLLGWEPRGWQVKAWDLSEPGPASAPVASRSQTGEE